MIWVRRPKIGRCKGSCEHGDEPLVSIKDKDFSKQTKLFLASLGTKQT